MATRAEDDNLGAERGRNGLDRRTLIKGAAAAGAAAWTAPVILGSLASPAAASSGSGCYRYNYEWQLGTNGTSTCGWATAACNQDLTVAGCVPSGGYNSNASPPSISFTSCNYNGSNLAISTLTVGGTSCKIVGYRLRSNNTCGNSTTSYNSNSLAISIATADNALLSIQFYVQCT